MLEFQFLFVKLFLGMLAPMLVQMERQIDREIAADNKANGVSCDTQTEGLGGVDKNTTTTGTDPETESDSEDEDELVEPVLMYGPQPQIITNDLKSLDEMVSLKPYYRMLFHLFY